MKVILTQEIQGHGGEGDVVEVKRGFAVNYLIPNGMAIVATEGELKQLDQRKHNIAKRESERVDTADKLVAKLHEAVVTIPMKVGDEGRLFGSVTPIMIAEAIAEQLGIELDRRKIDTRGAIKELGDHEVAAAVYRDQKATIVVKVVSDGEAVETGLTAEEAAELVDAERAAEEVVELVEEAVEVAEAAEVAEIVEEVIEEVVAEEPQIELVDAADVESYDTPTNDAAEEAAAEN